MTVLSPCFVDGEVQVLEVDLEAVPRLKLPCTCTAAVWYANKETIAAHLRAGFRIPGNWRINF